MYTFLACFLASRSAEMAMAVTCLEKSRANSSVWATSSYLATATFWSELSSLPAFWRSRYDVSLLYNKYKYL